jgi:hypothetical protein
MTTSPSRSQVEIPDYSLLLAQGRLTRVAVRGDRAAATLSVPAG